MDYEIILRKYDKVTEEMKMRTINKKIPELAEVERCQDALATTIKELHEKVSYLLTTLKEPIDELCRRPNPKESVITSSLALLKPNNFQDIQLEIPSTQNIAKSQMSIREIFTRFDRNIRNIELIKAEGNQTSSQNPSTSETEELEGSSVCSFSSTNIRTSSPI